MTRAWVQPKQKFNRGDTVTKGPRSFLKFGTIPKGELEVVKVIWKHELPLLGSGENRWFYECMSKNGGPKVEIQEKYLKQA